MRIALYSKIARRNIMKTRAEIEKRKIGYKDDDQAVSIANDTDYGLSGYVSGEPEHAQAIARKLRTGNVHINGAGPDFSAPFGGYKQSGNGREWGIEGFEEFLETKAMMGAA